MYRMAPEIILHHMNASRSVRLCCCRLVWLLEELQLPFEVKTYLRMADFSSPKELKDSVPFGRTPAVSLDGEVLTESGYVISRLVKGNRSSHLEEFNHTSEFWSHFSEGSFACGIMSSVLLGVNAQGWTSQTKPGQEGKLTLDSFLSFYLDGRSQKVENETNLAQVEDYLKAHPAGYFSGTDKPGEGDFMMFWPIHFLHVVPGHTYKVCPATEAWYERVKARPAFQQGMDRMAQEEGRAGATE